MATIQDRAQHTISQLDKEVCSFFLSYHATYIYIYIFFFYENR